MSQNPNVDVPMLEIMARMATLFTLRPRSSDPAVILAAVDDYMTRAPAMFPHMPVALDLSALDRLPDAALLEELLRGLRSRRLAPTAIRDSGDGAAALADSVGLGLLPAAAESASADGIPQADGDGRQAAAGQPARFVTRPVRSGQQVYAPGGDLVVLASVGAGAEIAADGCIHVYGALNGRAVAGVRGDERARILCQQFHAELVSIAGHYQVGEELSNGGCNQPAQVYLQGSALIMERLES